MIKINNYFSIDKFSISKENIELVQVDISNKKVVVVMSVGSPVVINVKKSVGVYDVLNELDNNGVNVRVEYV